MKIKTLFSAINIGVISATATFASVADGDPADPAGPSRVVSSVAAQYFYEDLLQTERPVAASALESGSEQTDKQSCAAMHRPRSTEPTPLIYGINIGNE
jgi:hypothetical protein